MSIGLLKDAGIAVPAGLVASSSDEAYSVAKQIGETRTHNVTLHMCIHILYIYEQKVSNKG